ncbi:phosphomethylpyrimidine synthase ThiC [bacterium]|nr:phosphomethylpyrimidine synthase ThiC [bacterium]
MTQLIEAKKGNITPEMKIVSEQEEISLDLLVEYISKGWVVIPKNKLRDNCKPTGIGKGLTTKINANIGTSKDNDDMNEEMVKARIAQKAGADAIMDLSTGKNLNVLRKKILHEIDVPIGTVPIYQAVVEFTSKGESVCQMTADDMFRVIEAQAKEGVDFITVHCGVTLATVERLKKEGRVADVVSRGGALLVQWMLKNNKENPLYTQYDRILEIAKKYDVTLSLGDGFRPGSIVDATDRSQIHELILLGELQQEALKAGAQVMIEGPGHVPFNQIETNILLQKRLCHEAPFYVLGPLVTDIGMGYDHITCAIGGAAAASYGADFLCYVTPSEHLRLPTIQDVEDGVIATKLAAHAGDIAKGNKKAIEKDHQMSVHRRNRNWDEQYKLAINPEKAKRMREERMPSDDKVCSMCGELCAIKSIEEVLN